MVEPSACFGEFRVHKLMGKSQHDGYEANFAHASFSACARQGSTLPQRLCDYNTQNGRGVVYGVGGVGMDAMDGSEGTDIMDGHIRLPGEVS